MQLSLVSWRGRTERWCNRRWRRLWRRWCWGGREWEGCEIGVKLPENTEVGCHEWLDKGWFEVGVGSREAGDFLVSNDLLSRERPFVVSRERSTVLRTLMYHGEVEHREHSLAGLSSKVLYFQINTKVLLVLCKGSEPNRCRRKGEVRTVGRKVGW